MWRLHYNVITLYYQAPSIMMSGHSLAEKKNSARELQIYLSQLDEGELLSSKSDD